MTKRLKYYTKSNLKEKEVDENIMVTGPMQHVEPIPDETFVLKTAQRTKGGAGPSGLDTDAGGETIND